MGKKVNRGFFSYLLLFLGIVIAFFVVCAVIMIFSPGTEIFGFSYFSEKTGEKEILTADVYNGEEKVENETFELNTSGQMNDIRTLIIKSNIYAINVKQKEKTTDSVKTALNVLVNTTVSGFAKDNKIKAEINCKYFKDSKTLELVANAPTGFLHFNNTAYINVLFPTEFNKNIKIEIENENGNVYLGNNSTSNIQSNTLNVNELDVNIKSGTLNSYNYFAIADSTKDSTLKTQNGKINFSSPISAKNLTVATENGNINLTNESVFVSNNFKVQSNSAFVEIKKATALNFDFDVAGGKIYSGELTGNVTFSQESNSCDFQAEKIVGSLLIGTINTDFDKIQTKTSVLIKNEISGNATISTNGEINIAKITNSIKTSNIRTNSSKVNVSEVEVNLDVVSNSGQIILGKIENSSIYGIRKKINVSSNSGNIILFFDQVENESSAISKNNIYSYFKNGDFKLTATAEKIVVNDEEQPSPATVGSNALRNLTLQSDKTITIRTQQ